MTDEITNLTTELIPIPTINPNDLPDESLPELLPQQQSMLNYIMAGKNYTEAYRLAGYSSVKHADRGAMQIVTAWPMKQYIENYRKRMRELISPDYIAERLEQIALKSINEDRPELYNPEIALKAYAELNKMAGNYAQQTLHINNVNTSLQDIRQARAEYIKDR